MTVEICKDRHYFIRIADGRTSGYISIPNFDDLSNIIKKCQKDLDISTKERHNNKIEYLDMEQELPDSANPDSIRQQMDTIIGENSWYDSEIKRCQELINNASEKVNKLIINSIINFVKTNKVHDDDTTKSAVLVESDDEIRCIISSNGTFTFKFTNDMIDMISDDNKTDINDDITDDNTECDKQISNTPILENISKKYDFTFNLTKNDIILSQIMKKPEECETYKEIPNTPVKCTEQYMHPYITDYEPF
jgi:hypothetical protein